MPRACWRHATSTVTAPTASHWTRSFTSGGSLSSSIWPGTEFTRTDVDAGYSAASADYAKRKSSSTDGRRYEGVEDEGFYDAIKTKRWNGQFGGPYSSHERPTHPWEGGYSRELLSDAQVGSAVKAGVPKRAW